MGDRRREGGKQGSIAGRNPVVKGPGSQCDAEEERVGSGITKVEGTQE